MPIIMPYGKFINIFLHKKIGTVSMIQSHFSAMFGLQPVGDAAHSVPL